MTGLGGKVAFVTGGAGGIGRSIALALAQSGADIALFDRNTATLENTVSELKALGRRALSFAGDVTDAGSISRAVAGTEKALGPIAILVNNAGICRVAPFLETGLKDLQDQLRVNVEGVFLCCQAVVPLMVQRRAGCVINMASFAGKSGRPYFGAYSASKFGVVGLTQALAAEVAPFGVRVNAICPGIVVSTDMRREIEEAHRRFGLPDTEERAKAIPLGRSAEPADVAGVAVFLASPAAQYITGESIAVTGGLLMD